jgi:hypothetical protein
MRRHLAQENVAAAAGARVGDQRQDAPVPVAVAGSTTSRAAGEDRRCQDDAAGDGPQEMTPEPMGFIDSPPLPIVLTMTY